MFQNVTKKWPKWPQKVMEMTQKWLKYPKTGQNNPKVTRKLPKSAQNWPKSRKSPPKFWIWGLIPVVSLLPVPSAILGGIDGVLVQNGLFSPVSVPWRGWGHGNVPKRGGFTPNSPRRSFTVVSYPGKSETTPKRLIFHNKIGKKRQKTEWCGGFLGKNGKFGVKMRFGGKFWGK